MQMSPSQGVFVQLYDRVVPSRMIPMVPVMYSEKDAYIAWFRTEFAAANAIIDTLCDHLRQLEGGVVEYESVFTAIHRRRWEWIPIITTQKYESIADVEIELRKVASKKSRSRKNLILQKVEEVTMLKEETTQSLSHSEKEIVSENSEEEAEISKMEAVSENSEEEAVSENSKKEAVSENSEEEAVSENSKKEAVPENSEEEAEISKMEAVSENSEEEAVSEISEEEAVSEISKKEAVSENSEEEAVSEISKKEAVSENSEEEAVSEISQKEAVSENSEEEAVSENSEEEAVSENSEKEAVPENSEDEAVSDNSEKEIISKNPDNCENGNDGDGEVVDEDTAKDDSPESEITDTGFQEVQPSSLLDTEICSNHEACEARRDQIRIMKGFIGKELVKGHMVNVVRGLKLYEDVFTENEVSKLTDFVTELRVAGRNGELKGDTFSLYNQQIKGNKREQIRFGVPVFEQIKDESASKSQRSDIEPIPAFFQNVIEHLIQWRIISEGRRPNSCIISFFDEDEHSQPYLKPPHIDQPISTLLLSESKMTFGHTVFNDNQGNYKGPLMLNLKEGSLLVMKGNSAEVARHVMCSSPNKRVSITFLKNRTQTERSSESIPSPTTTAMNLWHPGTPTPQSTPISAVNDYQPMGVIQNWGGTLRSPMVMLSPFRPVVMNPRRVPGGTGVFLPWTVRSRKPTKHLPPRAQKSRLLALSSPAETCKAAESTSDPSINLEPRETCKAAESTSDPSINLEPRVQ